jgi:hypothetical protein
LFAWGYVAFPCSGLALSLCWPLPYDWCSHEFGLSVTVGVSVGQRESF